MNTLVCLAVILFILMILIGGRKGARSFLALFFNFGVLAHCHTDYDESKYGSHYPYTDCMYSH